MKEDRAKWDKRYKGDVCLYGQEANGFLIDNIHLLPEGRVLDIAAGEGRNSVFFAEHGYKVDAVDISEAGLKKAQRLAGEAGAEIHCIHADLETYRIQENAYDVIANFNYLQRNLIFQIKRGLKIGGAVIFETYLMDQTALSSGPKNPDHLLRHNELLGFFKDFRVLVYREGIYGERGRERAIAGIIATKEWGLGAFTNSCPSINEDFCSRSRHAKKLTAGICTIFRGLFFEHNTEIGQKDHLWMDTNSAFPVYGKPSPFRLEGVHVGCKWP